MKKALLIIAVIAVLSGCTTNTKTLTCTSENTSGNITSKTKYRFTIRTFFIFFKHIVCN